jgi:SAM-dependent methyltransferase
MNDWNRVVAGLYDDWMASPLLSEYYGYSSFFNLGYWTEGTNNQSEACENLVDKLLEFLPEKAGNILDAACGLGATTRRLLNYYPASAITAINISRSQVLASSRKAPGCGFALIDAASLGFAANSFDTIITVEAAFHFKTRLTFLQEACRVLKPGGLLILSDGILSPPGGEGNFMVPPENDVGLDEYARAYIRAGLTDLRIEHATDQCWGGFREHLLSWAGRKLRSGEIDQKTMSGLERSVETVVWEHYLLVSARKPLSLAGAELAGA